MTLSVFNTLTAKKEPFEPLNPGKVGMYVCGVTVYDLSHIGHARAYIAFDVIYRYLKHRGFDVTYVRNFTDIDDKIIRKANEEGCTIREVSGRYMDAYTRDMDALGLLKPDIEPKCTQYIEAMQTFIARLVDKGYAYVAPGGDVYYRVRSFMGYGKLSGRRLDDMRAGASERIQEAELAGKEDPFDFALWKSAKEGEPSWESPWGPGRPGWHIECSVMSRANLGETFDIHGGGKDLIFPHHENEIAQSEAHNGKPFARYWLHNGFINVPGAEGGDTKMSKSLGNFYTVRDVLAAYHPESIKLFMLSTSYRNDILFTDEGLKNAQVRTRYLYQTLAKVDEFLTRGGDDGGAQPFEPELVQGLTTRIEAAMDDDFNTQKAIAELSEPFKLANELCDHPKGRDRKQLLATLRSLKAGMEVFGRIFGILDKDPATVLDGIKRLQLKFLDVDMAAIEELLTRRTQARAAKDWAASDALRDELLCLGIVIKDTPAGTTWDLRE